MMREIKFRAWDRVYKHFHKGDLIRDYVIGEFIDNPEYEVTQYTGLKDKNGKKIYEGDILKVIEMNEFDEEIETLEYTSPVYWKEYGYCIDESETVSVPLVCIDNTLNWVRSDVEIEVIGNIYEHSHLLEGK